jgi:hypothetical protein
MTFQDFLKEPIKDGLYKGMMRSSYVRIVCKSAGLKRAKQLLNGWFGGWRSQYEPTEAEQGKVRNIVDYLYTALRIAR